jgi:hypothetical protein
MLKPSRTPYGFKNLLVYKKAEELQKECSLLTTPFPPLKTLYSLSDQMNRSARSTKQNIVEGWKRNSTGEYYDFLGFSLGANTELEEDCNDIWNGVYPELMGLKGIMGERGEKESPINPIPSLSNSKNPLNPIPPLSKPPLNPSTPLNPFSSNPINPIPPLKSNPLNPFTPFNPILDIEKIPFYPLDKTLPPILQLKLRCKELNFLLKKLQDSLSLKMKNEKTLTAQDKQSLIQTQRQKSDQFAKEILEKYGVKNRRE